MSEPTPYLSDSEGPQQGQLQFQLLVDGVRDYAIYLLDTTGRVKSWNSGAERIKGYAASEIIGRHFSVFYNNEDQAAGEPARALAVAEATGRYASEAIRVRKDGSLFWADVVITPVRNEAGALVGFAKITRDVTDRRQSDEQSTLLAHIFDYNPDGIVIIDAEGRIAKVNDQLARLFGYPREALLGERIEILLPQRFHSNHVSQRSSFFAHPQAREMGTGLELYGRHSDGREFPVDILIGPVRSGTQTLGIAIVRDATTRKEAAAAMAEAQRQQATLEERARAAEAMRQTSEMLSTVIKASPLAIFAIDRDENLAIWNPAAERIFGWMAAEVIGLPSQSVAQQDATPGMVNSRSLLDRVRKDGSFHNVENSRNRRDGTTVDLNYCAAVLYDSAGGEDGVLFIADDVTQHKAAEEQLRQAQKMEAIGQLTGGMAHDFNNLLAVIIGNLGLLRPLLAPGGEPLELADDALDAALHGAELTRRLLTFARRQSLSPQRVALNDLVANIVKLLQRTLGEQISIALDLASVTWPVVVDPAQLEAAIANLATNARDAMPKGGSLTIVTANRHLDDDYAALHAEVTVGDYALIEVSDTGTGMTPEVVTKIFEPFYTTKEQGKGTGLGLSMVFGFMKQSGGHINVYSEPGIGTTFRLYLPRALGDAVEAEPPTKIEVRQAGGEIVLVVEDNAALRRVTARQLTGLGYRVIETDSAVAALAVLERERIDILFSDVVMPGEMDGFALAQHVIGRWPSVKVLLTSGFPETHVNGAVRAPKLAVRLLTKPYPHDELARAIREALDT